MSARRVNSGCKVCGKPWSWKVCGHCGEPSFVSVCYLQIMKCILVSLTLLYFSVSPLCSIHWLVFGSLFRIMAQKNERKKWQQTFRLVDLFVKCTLMLITNAWRRDGVKGLVKRRNSQNVLLAGGFVPLCQSAFYTFMGIYDDGWIKCSISASFRFQANCMTPAESRHAVLWLYGWVISL